MKHLSKILCIILSAVFVISVVPFASSASFSDVSVSAWYYDEVKYCSDNSIVYGVGGNLFEPERNITRGELVTILARVFGGSQPGRSVFIDCPENAYYTPYVNWAYNCGIVYGISETTFEPNTIISREQAMTMLFRAGVYDRRFIGVSDAIPYYYEDFDSVSSWAKMALAVLCNCGIVNGNEKYEILPKNNITRAETCRLIFTYLLYTGKIDPEHDLKNSLGVDISAFQKGIVLSDAKKAGVEFAILRLWYDKNGVTLNGVSNVDSSFETYYNDCKSAGISVGAYWFLYPKSLEDVKYQANECIKLLKGKTFDLPICLDFEEESINYYQKQTGKIITSSIINSYIETWCDIVSSAGYDVLIYTNYNVGRNIEESVCKKYNIWLAQWVVAGTLSDSQIDEVINGGKRYRIISDIPIYNYVKIWQFGKAKSTKFGLNNSEIDLNIIL